MWLEKADRSSSTLYTHNATVITTYIEWESKSYCTLRGNEYPRIRMAQTKKKNWQYQLLGRMQSKWTFQKLSLWMQNSTDTLENFWKFLIKLNTASSYDLAILLLDFYPRNMKTHVHIKTCIGVLAVMQWDWQCLCSARAQV